MNIQVPAEGPLDARIILIGEAPGAWEERQRRPFVGPSGNKLYEWWDHEAVGLRRIDCYITNVVKRRPPDNKIAAIPADELSAWIAFLHEELAKLTQPAVIVPMGNTALFALTGRRNITDYRGSILSYQDQRERIIRVIPTVHPAFTLYEGRTSWDRICQLDWIRIVEESRDPTRPLPERTPITNPTDDAVQAFVDQVHATQSAPGAMLSLDIETPGNQVACVGFALSPHTGICIPTDTELRRRAVRLICESTVPKVMQNGLFDTFYLAFDGIRVRNWVWDTMAMHHCLEPRLPHTLDFMASVDTREPFWKKEAKDPDEIAKHASNRDALWVYNTKDAMVTWELASLYRQRLIEHGKIAFYHQHYRKIFRPLLSMMIRGIRVDRTKRTELYAEHQAAIQGIREELNRIAGQDLYGPKGSLVPLRLSKFLYGKLGLPKQYNRKATTRTKEGRLPTTTNEVALRRLQLRHPRQCGSVIEKILQNRRHQKLSEFLRDQLIDADDRFRASFRFTTDTGRLASRKNPWRTGGNLQNIDREIRHTFVPEEGHLFLEVDLSQAEDRIVKILTGNDRLIAMARSHPSTFDAHTHNAAILYGVPVNEVTKEQRQVGKSARHAANYGMGPQTLSDNLLKDGFVRTVEECQTLLERVFVGDSADILEWQRRVRKQVLTKGYMENPFGRRLSFRDVALCEAIYRQAYAFVPQSTVPDIINQWGLIPLYREITNRKLPVKLHAQVHDAILMSVPPDCIHPVIQFLQANIERPLTYDNGQELIIPCTYKVGRTWAGGYEWKRVPTAEEVRDVIASL